LLAISARMPESLIGFTEFSIQSLLDGGDQIAALEQIVCLSCDLELS